MNEEKIKPEKITKPIQLLAAWLLGLTVLDSSFLIAADTLGTDTWQSGLLVIAATLNVPVFLLAVFLLQTKFRPELQEDSYYSTYLSNKTNELIRVKNTEKPHLQYREKLESIIENNKQPEEQKATTTDEFFNNPNFSCVLFGINHHLEDRKTIVDTLSKHGIHKCTLFGSEKEPPGRNISISEYLPAEVVAEILKIGKELNFDTYNFFDNFTEETDEDILLGSYGKSGYVIM